MKKGVNIIGFGSFGVSTRKARTGRNPKPANPSKSKPQRTSDSKPEKPSKTLSDKNNKEPGNPGSLFIKPRRKHSLSQGKVEGRSFAGFTAGPDFSSVSLNDPLYYRKPDPCTLILFPGMKPFEGKE